MAAPAPAAAPEEDVAPPGPPVRSPAKRRVVRGLLIGGALGGALGAANLTVGAAPLPPAADQDARHAAAARYTGWCVFGGGLIGLLSGGAAVARDKFRGGAEAPPPGFDH